MENCLSNEGMHADRRQSHLPYEANKNPVKNNSPPKSQFAYRHLIGDSKAILEIKQIISQVAPSDTSVLIQGETGTGKELVARAIHYHSPRAGNIFVPVDCAAISETIMESELFGHVKGAFTSASDSVQGLIRTADTGTLFLDEVGELTPLLQSKLLRTIQEREVRPVGSCKTYPVDVRIVAATNCNLLEKVAQKSFRDDLLYRINVVTLEIPPLRDRKEDIPVLAMHFLERFSTDSAPVNEITSEALSCLMNYHWPGNVRELENVIQRAVAMVSDQKITHFDLPGKNYVVEEPYYRKLKQPEDDRLAAYEKMAIINALEKSNGNRKMAARILGIGEATLYRKIKCFQLLD